MTRLGTTEGSVAVIHPGSGGLDKRCPHEAMEAVMLRLEHDGWRAAWMIGPDEMERFGMDYVQDLERTAPLIYEDSVERAADLACGADLFIGNDAGMTHVAALAGVPTVTLFGPTDPRVWRPRGARCSTVGFPAPDQPLTDWVDRVTSTVRDATSTARQRME